MKKRQAVRSAAFDFDEATRRSPYASFRTGWMYEDAASVALGILSFHPRPGRVTEDEVAKLVTVVASTDLHQGHSSTLLNIGGCEIRCQHRDFRVGNTHLCISPHIPGVFPSRDVPSEPGIEDKVRRALEAELTALRYEGPPILDVRVRAGKHYGFNSTDVVLERPEGGGAYIITGYFEHLPGRKFLEEVCRRAKDIEQRWNHRFEIASYVQKAVLWAQDRASKCDGIEFVDTQVWVGHKNDKIESIRVTCIFSALGDRLEIERANVSAHDDERFRQFTARHRKAQRKLASGHAEDAYTVHPIVAAAIRAQIHQHGQGILSEIEAVLNGGYKNPTNPRKRQINVFSIKNGELSAPVTLGKKVRFSRNQVIAGSIRSLPETVMNCLSGKQMREVIDHPWLEGLTIKSATITLKGLNIRPVEAPQKLQPLLEEIRAAVSKDLAS